MKMKKRFLGILLSLVMVLGLMPGMTLVAKAEATQWVVGDSINLNGKYFIPDDMEANVYLGIDESVAIPQPEFDSNMNQWRFRCEIPATVAHGYVYCRLPSGKTKEEAPAGFRIAGGTGTSDDPYTFGLVYQKDVDDAKVIAQAMEEVHARMGSDMISSGSPIQLIDPPTTVLPDGYSMVYAVTVDNTAPDSTAYGASVPTATDAGTYYVWYKVVGDSNHTDSAAKCVKVTIAKKNEEKPTQTPETEAPAPEAKEDSPEAEKQIPASILLNSQFLVSWKGTKVQVTWGSVHGADTYEIYAEYCGKKQCVKISTVHSGNKLTFSQINGKRLNPKKAVKAYVEAYRDGRKLGRTILGHAAGSKNKRTNAKKVKTSKSTYKLKAGKGAKIKAGTVKENKRKKLLGTNHSAWYRYATSDTNVATVDKKGRIKAVGTGTCNVWVYAQNGRSKKLTVIVQQ